MSGNLGEIYMLGARIGCLRLSMHAPPGFGSPLALLAGYSLTFVSPLEDEQPTKGLDGICFESDMHPEWP